MNRLWENWNRKMMNFQIFFFSNNHKVWIEHTKNTSVHCGHYVPLYTNCGIYMRASYDYLKNRGLTSPIYQKEINGKYLYRALCSISTSDIEKIGLIPTLSPPSSFMITELPFPPHCIRPNKNQTDDETLRGCDDLTFALMLVIKANENLKQSIAKEKEKKPPKTIEQENENFNFSDEEDENEDQQEVKSSTRRYSEDAEISKVLRKARSKKISLSIREGELYLSYCVSGYLFNNLPSAQKLRLRSGEPIKSIPSQLNNKKGFIRTDLLGKRTNFSARNVINGDGFLHMNQLSIPLSCAKTLYRKMKVTELNFHYAVSLVRNGPNGFPTCVYIEQDGKKLDCRWIDTDTFEIKLGSILYRTIQDGDHGIFGRQPSLHRCSLMVHELKVRDTPTFDFHYSCNAPYNADFDGDEMNLSPIRFDRALAETNLMLVEHNALDPKNGHPILSYNQDAILGAYLLTNSNVYFNKQNLIDFLTHIYYAEKIDRLKKFLPKFQNFLIHEPNDHVRLWRGTEVLEYLFPSTLYVNHKKLKIKNGKFLFGRLGRDELKALIYAFLAQFGDRVTIDFITASNLGFEWFLFYKGTTFSLQHCLTRYQTKIKDIIHHAIQKGNQIVAETRKVHRSAKLPTSIEAGIQSILEGAKSNCARLLLEDFGSYARHGPREGTEAKSKGNVVNLLQMTAFLGQQYVPEGRMTSSNSIFSQMEKEFYNVETQGMVEDNFINGLKPINYFLHSVGGRTGIVDTAVRTSDTGYIERRMAKAGENVSTFADLTVRTADEHIVEWNYGDDQLNPQFVQWKLLNILSVDDNEFQKLYVWDDPLSALQEEEKKKLMGYRAVITKIRKQLFPYHVKREVSTPVDLESLFEKISCLTKKRPVMTVDYIIERVDQAISSWMETGILVLRGNEDWNKNWWTRRPDRKKEEEKYLSYPLLAYLHEHFHSKILLEKYHFSKEDLNGITND